MSRHLPAQHRRHTTHHARHTTRRRTVRLRCPNTINHDRRRINPPAYGVSTHLHHRHTTLTHTRSVNPPPTKPTRTTRLHQSTLIAVITTTAALNAAAVWTLNHHTNPGAAIVLALTNALSTITTLMAIIDWHRTRHHR